MTTIQSIRMLMIHFDSHEIAMGIIILICMILWSCSIMDAKRILDLDHELRHLKGRVKTLERLDDGTRRPGDQG